MSVIFAKTRHEYDSYQDFWSLVSLSGFPTCYVDEIDPTTENTYIFTPHSGEFFATVSKHGKAWNARKAKIIWWLLERPDGDKLSLEKRMSPLLPHIDDAWASDNTVVAMHPKFKRAVLGGHDGLSHCPPRKDKDYDFAHMSYVIGRRVDVYTYICVRGLREAPNAWGKERSKILAATKLMVNVHQYPLPVIAPLRFAVAAAHHLPVLTETVKDPFPHVIGHDLWQADYDSLPDEAVKLLENPRLLAQLAENLHERLCVEWTFRRGVEEALK